jgi:hypothetical protein
MAAPDADPVIRIRHNECPVQTKPASKNFKAALQELVCVICRVGGRRYDREGSKILGESAQRQGFNQGPICSMSDTIKFYI